MKALEGRLQSGQVGEKMAEQYFHNHGWHMTRSQPPITILGMISPGMVSALKRFIPRLGAYGHMVIGRMGKGGVPDYLGFDPGSSPGYPEFRACEVKCASGDSMPASRVSKEQRAFLGALPSQCAYVGIFWQDTQKFTMHKFISTGSYKKA